MSRLDWAIVFALTAGPWLALLLYVEIDTRRRRKRRERGRVVHLERGHGFARRRAGG